MSDTAMQSVEEKETDSLTDDLKSAFESLESDESEEVLEDATEEIADTETDTGEDEESEETEEIEESDEDSSEEIEDKIEAPQHWATEDKELFNGQPKEVQNWLLNRHKSMEADYTRKTQELAGARKLKEELDGIFEPYRQQFAMQGMDEVGAVRYLFSWKQHLDQHPQETILALARDYGVNLNPQETEDDISDPAISALRQEIAELKAQNAQNTQRAQQTEQQTLLAQVNAFREAKDEKGEAKYPHFETVRQDMAVLVGNGRAKDLEEAYGLAVRLHPDIFDSMLTQKQDQEAAEAKRKADEAKRAKAAKAKKAASGVRSGSASVKNEAPKTLKDDILSVMNQLEGV